MDINYKIELRPAALRALRKIHPRDQKRIQGAIALLSKNPWPPGAQRLRGREGMRVRVGDYRVIYTVKNDVLLVVVATLGHRKSIYG